MSENEAEIVVDAMRSLQSQLSTALERVKELEYYKSKWISDAACNKGLADGANKRITALETENAELRAAIADHELLHGKEWVAAVRAVNGDVETAKVQMIAKYVGELAVAREALDMAEGALSAINAHQHLDIYSCACGFMVRDALSKIDEAKKSQP